MGAGGGPLTAMAPPAPTLALPSMTHAADNGTIAAATIAASSFPMLDPETKPTIVYAGGDPALPLPPLP
jgi:hypothetical protein